MKPQNLKTLIIDDEPDARDVLRTLIGQFCPNLSVCGEADSVAAGLDSIQAFNPALVFLDVDLHPGTGFDILDTFPDPSFKTVFTTAHDDFALKAYHYRALHYLLKPIDPQDLVQVTRELQTGNGFAGQSGLDAALPGQNAQGNLLLPTTQGINLVHPSEISYIQADEKYTKVVLCSGEKIFVSQSMKVLESLLPKDNFLRPHQSFIVRLDAIRKIHKDLGGLMLILKDKTEIPVSRRNKDLVLQAIGIGQ